MEAPMIDPPTNIIITPPSTPLIEEESKHEEVEEEEVSEEDTNILSILWKPYSDEYPDMRIRLLRVFFAMHLESITSAHFITEYMKFASSVPDLPDKAATLIECSKTKLQQMFYDSVWAYCGLLGEGVKNLCTETEPLTELKISEYAITIVSTSPIAEAMRIARRFLTVQRDLLNDIDYRIRHLIDAARVRASLKKAHTTASGEVTVLASKIDERLSTTTSDRLSAYIRS